MPVSKEIFRSKQNTSKHEVIIRAKEKNNIILNQNRKSIYWTSSPVNTLFVVYIERFLEEILRFFYNFLSTSVVGSEREQGLSLLEGMEGGELLWSNLLPAEMKPISIGLIVTANEF